MYVFQYGSNCDSERLNSADRLNGLAKSLGKACTVEDFELEFDVYSTTNQCAASDMIRCPGSGNKVWGVLYDVPEDHVVAARTDGSKTLAQIEGPLYRPERIMVEWQRTQVEVITFLVRNPVQTLTTSPDYVAHIIHGLRAHNVDQDYIESVRRKAITNDPQREDSYRAL